MKQAQTLLFLPKVGFYIFKSGLRCEPARRLTRHARGQGSVRDRFNKLLAEFKAKMRREEGESGTKPKDLSVAETLLEETDEKITSAKTDAACALNKESEKQKSVKERQKALSVGDLSMRTWAAKSASIDGADSTDWTDEESVKDTTRSSRKR